MFSKIKSLQSKYNTFISEYTLAKKSSNTLFEFFFKKLLTPRRFIILTVGVNAFSLFYLLPKYNKTNLDISVSRNISRKIGKIMDTTVPVFMRKSVYGLYMKVYNVNEDEILDPNLENYKNLKEFFTREIKVCIYVSSHLDGNKTNRKR